MTYPYGPIPMSLFWGLVTWVLRTLPAWLNWDSMFWVWTRTLTRSPNCHRGGFRSLNLAWNRCSAAIWTLGGYGLLPPTGKPRASGRSTSSASAPRNDPPPMVRTCVNWTGVCPCSPPCWCLPVSWWVSPRCRSVRLRPWLVTWPGWLRQPRRLNWPGILNSCARAMRWRTRCAQTGSSQASSRPRAEATLREIYAQPLADGVPFFATGLATAELAKVAANSFLATKISFINAMAEICDVSGGDVVRLSGYWERVADRIGITAAWPRLRGRVSCPRTSEHSWPAPRSWGSESPSPFFAKLMPLTAGVDPGR